ncbi:uncharacterized protein LOC117326561 [Pecten maximus]|uniref:uncharacterized protein LOC117326561 n=1 Tax=Pecten maximus TaxID=6579 RepID=UPI001459030A|nr:uncharacterized protein LOC117326561 [Pecten maximus]
MSLIQPFNGQSSADAKMWIARFELFVKTKGFNANKAKSVLPLMLKDGALRWYMSLPDEIKDDYDSLTDAFMQRYGPDENTKWQRTAQLYQTKQSPGQTVEDFITLVTSKGQDVGLSEEQTQQVIINGLKANIRQFVLQNNPQNMEDLRRWAKLGELTCSDENEQHHEVVAAITRLEEQLQALSVQAAQGAWNNNKGSQNQRQSQRKCGFCGRDWHEQLTNCPARGKTCAKCKKQNHFARVCRSAPITEQ